MMRILLIEDCDTDIEAFKSSVDAWNVGKSESIVVAECKSLEDSLNKLLTVSEWDGIVLDLKLPNDKNGKDVVKRLNELYWRIPVVVLTGTPSEDNDTYQEGCFKSFIKGEQEHKVILDLLWDCKRSGLMELLGGKGSFEKYLKTVFDKCIVPRFDEWRSLLSKFGSDDAEKETKAALSRHVLNCLQAILQQDDSSIQPEECYLLLPDEALATPRPGMILQNSQNSWYLVLNPACDLALQDGGSINSTLMLLVRIDSEEEVLMLQMQSPEEGQTLSKRLREHNKHVREEAFKNNGPIRFHWLPKCGNFDGGFVNFRNIISADISKFGSEYVINKSKFVVHPDILKNIQSRFANYYARQGQPNINITRFSSDSFDGFI